MVIAVVGERDIVKNPSGCAFDWVLMDLDDSELEQALTPEIQEVMEQHGFLTKPKVEAFTTYEYAEDAPDELRRH